MLQILLQGIVLGLILTVLIGPVFFLLIQTSIREGFRHAFFLELGVISSDIFCIFIAYKGVANVFDNPQHQKVIGIICGIVLIGFGLASYFAKTKKSETEENLVVKKYAKRKLVLKGFLFNISNPSVLLFWFGSVGVAVSQFGAKKYEMIIYFSGTIITYFLFDVLKAYTATRIKHFLTPSTFSIINKVAGVGIMIFGTVLILKVFGMFGGMG